MSVQPGQSSTGALRLSELTRDYGEVRALDGVSLDVRAGEFVTLLGASGSGKTTTLRCVAGFLKPDAGRVFLDDRDITDVAIHARNIGMVFQNYALFPHMTAADNVAFALTVLHVPRNEVQRRVAEALAIVHLTDQAGRYPRQLSGGQQQRVALARAIVFRPPLLLMDEPLGALDKRLREAMQVEITRISRELGVTVLYVTHDQEEALAMSDRIAVYRQGRIEQVGRGEDLYERPASLFVASFMGESSIFRGRVESDLSGTYLNDGRRRIPVAEVAGGRLGVEPGQRAALVVRPERMRVRGSGAGSDVGPGSMLRGVLRDAVYLGSSRKYLVDVGDGQQVLVRAAAGGPEVWPNVGEEVVVSWDVEDGVLVRDDEVGPWAAGGSADPLVAGATAGARHSALELGR
jgi:putative spermidine/putrescine transport system ATP-binding protein